MAFEILGSSASCVGWWQRVSHGAPKKKRLVAGCLCLSVTSALSLFPLSPKPRALRHPGPKGAARAARGRRQRGQTRAPGPGCCVSGEIFVSVLCFPVPSPLPPKLTSAYGGGASVSSALAAKARCAKGKKERRVSFFSSIQPRTRVFSDLRRPPPLPPRTARAALEGRTGAARREKVRAASIVCLVWRWGETVRNEERSACFLAVFFVSNTS